MKIENLFTKDLSRPINGVVTVDQQDDATVWQELEEYVVTRELDGYFNTFFTAYLGAMDNPKDTTLTSWMGVWVSGFFGSGKSHFIKILSYLLGNRKVTNPATSETKRASDFLDGKIKDPLLLAEIKRAVSKSTDVILFNIDSKADTKEGRDAILSVFVRVFNEMQGFSGDTPHIAELERYLTEKGLLDRFHLAFKAATGDDWVKERDAYLLRSDELIAALANTLGKSVASATEWFEKAETNYTLNIEGFAKRVNDYLDRRGPEHRIVFVIDEVGQFIGTDTHLMLNLQTITEDLGRLCAGRAWVIVTSQEDIDAVLGEISGTKANDFSKIQGRFHTRLSLSSTNTDEVIQVRLLEKTDEAKNTLEELFAKKGDILKNQLSFSASSASLKSYKDPEDFALNYPFAPYQFFLLQRIFESIRKVGATGLSLSRGERSLLDAFQSAGKNLAARPVGALAPLYEFYPAIQSFLDTAVKRTIEQAAENPALEPFDLQLLRVLFLIRYVDVIKSNIDNLVTLCIDEIDADRLELKRKIEGSLQRLEKQTLINRSGDLYFFLTNEERDVSREIKNVDISGSEENKFLAELIYDEVLKGENKHKYRPNKKDYGFNRFCDGRPFGSRVDQELTIEVISAFADDYQLFNPAKCIGYSAESGGKILIRLSDNKDLGLDLRTYLQTDKYIRLKSDAAAPDTLKRILLERSDQNRERKTRLVRYVGTLLGEGGYYAVGQVLTPTTTDARSAVAEAQDYLIKNIFTKLEYLKELHDDPQKEIRATLTSDDIGQYNLQLNIEAGNVQALKEIREFIDLSSAKNHRIPLNELVERFGGRPYGWPEWEIVLLIARLMMAGELGLMMEGATLEPRGAIDPLTKSGRWRQVAIIKRKAVQAADLDSARRLGQAIFNKIGPDSEEGLYAFLREQLNGWKEELIRFKALADAGNYPGLREIDQGLEIVNSSAIQNSYEFFAHLKESENDLRALADDMHDLKGFYDGQRPIWDKLRRAMSGAFKDNRQLLEFDKDASTALARMDEILATPAPYRLLQETDALIATVDIANQKLLKERREAALALVEIRIGQVKEALQEIKANADASNQTLYPLQQIKKRIAEEESIQKIFYDQTQNTDDAFERALALIDATRPKGATEDDTAQARPVRYLKPASIYPRTYLESDKDVEEYLAKLRDHLQELLKGNARIRLQ